MSYQTIKEFPKYEINKEGDIRNKSTLKSLSQNLGTKGYYQVNIGNTCRKVHRLLAETFIENVNNLETVNHIDGNKVNNSLSNLEWMSRQDNVRHSREVLMLKPIPYSKSNKKHHLIGKTGINSTRGKQIKATFKDESSKLFGSAYEAALELFGNREIGKMIRQSISRKSGYFREIKFEDYG